jgi:hypothetical protein
MSRWIGMAAFMGAAFSVGWLVVRWFVRRGTAEYRREAELLATISALPTPDAASQAMKLLSQGGPFRCVESPAHDPAQLELLAPEQRAVLGRFESVALVGGSAASVGRSFLGSSAIKPGFIRIGLVAPSTDVEGEISVRAGEETIFELYAGEEPDAVFGTYRSIYHWVLATAEESRSQMG